MQFRNLANASVPAFVVSVCVLLGVSGLAIASYPAYTKAVAGSTAAEDEQGEEEAGAAEDAAQTTAGDLLSQLDSLVFSYQTGSDSWYYQVCLYEDGTLSGVYHDERDASYGTVYHSPFTGTVGNVQMQSACVYTLEVESLEIDEGGDAGYTVDGVASVACAVPGLGESATLTVYLPGTATSSLPSAVAAAIAEVDGAVEGDELVVCVICSDAEEGLVFIASA